MTGSGGGGGEQRQSVPVAVAPSDAPPQSYQGCEVRGQNITGANLSGADIIDCTLTNCTVDSSHIRGSCVFTGCSVTSFTLHGHLTLYGGGMAQGSVQRGAQLVNHGATLVAVDGLPGGCALQQVSCDPAAERPAVGEPVMGVAVSVAQPVDPAPLPVAHPVGPGSASPHSQGSGAVQEADAPDPDPNAVFRQPWLWASLGGCACVLWILGAVLLSTGMRTEKVEPDICYKAYLSSTGAASACSAQGYSVVEDESDCKAAAAYLGLRRRGEDVIGVHFEYPRATDGTDGCLACDEDDYNCGYSGPSVDDSAYPIGCYYDTSESEVAWNECSGSPFPRNSYETTDWDAGTHRTTVIRDFRHIICLDLNTTVPTELCIYEHNLFTTQAVAGIVILVLGLLPCYGICILGCMALAQTLSGQRRVSPDGPAHSGR